MGDCNHDCSSCSKTGCAEKKDFKEKQNQFSNIKKVIGIVCSTFSTAFLPALS